MLYFFQKWMINLMAKRKNRFEFITKTPERILPATFFLLCLTGGIILYLPFCSPHGVSFLDAMFTAVSAVCVTGLSVVSVSDKFTGVGQLVLLLLIQAGGLGIMSISSIIFILLGKRMSLTHEKNARNIFEAESKEEIKKSLIRIFKYTFIVELTGAIILSACFTFSEHSLLTGLKFGFFTSISAFCNAGFFLKNDNLIGYNSFPLLTYTVSFLIILGGMSPAICLMLQNIFKGKKLPPVAVLVFYTTLALLIGGTLFFFLSEYNGVLSGMSIADKIHNAWFQSATSRTAGFNSVDLSSINPGTFLLMVALMIAGGSPGGTAGGLKTTTISVLFLTCYNAIRIKDNVVRNRVIKLDTIKKAITLTVLYLSILVTIVLMLLTTQTAGAEQLVFEAASALGTVGLSMGATSQLDGVGKVIIIAAMFLGRVAPATLICYLNTKNIDSRISYPDAKISLT